MMREPHAQAWGEAFKEMRRELPIFYDTYLDLRAQGIPFPPFDPSLAPTFVGGHNGAEQRASPSWGRAGGGREGGRGGGGAGGGRGDAREEGGRGERVGWMTSNTAPPVRGGTDETQDRCREREAWMTGAVFDVELLRGDLDQVGLGVED
jgi:hypothetical protein